jgi:hypothetical protein
MILELQNPSDQTFTGSGGALGAGLEIRMQDRENGQPLIIESACNGRRCGEPAGTDPGYCGVEPRNVDPHSRIRLNWDGRYLPRSHDFFGECLGTSRAIEPGTVSITLCGRLRGEDTRMAQLICRSCNLDTPAGETRVATDVPGSVTQVDNCFRDLIETGP